MKHIPVLLNSVMESLGDISGAHVIDATFGAGGYTRAFLDAGACVTAFDRDPHVVDDAMKIKREFGDRFNFIARPFSAMTELEPDSYDATVFDLGISSMQIDESARGFSFRFDGPLDMRMSGAGETAAEMVARLPIGDIVDILHRYGDVSRATPIAKAIKQKLPRTTFELKDLIFNPRDIAPVFQALRIAVNNEMGELENALAVVPKLLRTGGKCICVTFHSLEDRIVKDAFRKWTTAPGDPRMPVVTRAQFVALKTKTPDEIELEHNPRAHSAHMRGVQKSY